MFKSIVISAWRLFGRLDRYIKFYIETAWDYGTIIILYKNNTMSDRSYHNIIMVKTTNAHTVILFLICRNSRIPF